MPISSENSNSDDVKLHLQEADDLKKQWFNYVFESIRKLYDKIESNSLQVKKEKEELLKILMDYRKEFSENVQECGEKSKDDLEKLRNNLESTIDALQKQLNGISLSNSELKHLLDNEANALKIEFMTKLETVIKIHIAEDELKFTEIKDSIKILSDATLVTKTKLGVYMVVISLVVSTLLGGTAVGIVVMFKNAIKAFFLGV